MADQAETIIEETAAGGGKKGLPVKLIVVVFSLLLLLGAAGLALKSGMLGLTAQGDDRHAAADEDGVSTELGPVYALDTFIVNLADERGTKYLKTKLSLELNNALAAKEIDKRLPQVRDTILTLLSTRSFEDIRHLEGKYQLRAEIMAILNPLITSGDITNIYFTEFVVQ
ncbi:MAG: flagellar basal body-associated FliL family protein [Thermodesulfobacteriota bacterium]